MKRFFCAALLLAFALAAALAHAARPLVTDDARVVEPGHCQVETYYKDQRNHAGSEFWLLPACNVGGAEVQVGANRVDGEENAIVAAKILFRPLGVAELYGQRAETPTRHYGIRYALLGERLQLDLTRGERSGDPATRFYTIGVRLFF